MDLLSKLLRIVAGVFLVLVVAGSMLAFINSDSHEFLVAMQAAPLALICFAASILIDPQHAQGQHSMLSRQR